MSLWVCVPFNFMIRTTLAYIRKENKILMLYRNKKEKDINKNKWIGIGGKALKKEKILDCLKREIKEETNLDVIKSRLVGKIFFNYNEYQKNQYIMYLYEIEEFSGELNYDCKEGSLKWIDIKDIFKLDLWQSDKYFLCDVINKTSFKEMIINYEDDVLISVFKDDKKIYDIHEEMIKKTLKLAYSAKEKGEIPCACIITYRNKIVAKAINQKEKYQKSNLHSETIAISKALKKLKQKYLNNCTLYTNLEPCFMCAGQIILTRVKQLHYILDDPKAGFIKSNFDVLKNKGVMHKIKVIQHKKYEKETKKLIQDFFKTKRRVND